MTKEEIKELIDSKIYTNTGKNVKGNDVNEVLTEMLNFLSLSIPKLQIESKGSNVYVKLNPFRDRTWISMNPRVFVFHKKSSKKHIKTVNGESQGKIYYGGYHHPTHLNGENFPNSSFFSGSTSFPYNTEFPLIISEAFQRQSLDGFNVREFYFLKGETKIQPVPILTPASELISMVAVGRKDSSYSRSNYFKFAIAIDNPEPDANCPVLFGELSDSIQVLPHMSRYEGVNTMFFKILHETNTIKRQ